MLGKQMLLTQKDTPQNMLSSLYLSQQIHLPLKGDRKPAYIFILSPFQFHGRLEYITDFISFSSML